MTTTAPKRVYFHETFDVCDGLPDLLHRFPLRALLVAKPGERVVLGNYNQGVPTELALLNRLGFGPRPEDLIYVNPAGGIVSGDRDLDDAEVLPFSGTTRRARTFAQKHGATFLAPDRPTCLNANSKAVFQAIVEHALDEHGQIGPRGFVTSLRDAPSAIARFVSRFGKCVVKGVHSASGLQQVVVEPGATPNLIGLPDEVVVQEWVPHDYSPSLQCVVERDGTVRQLSTTVQILDGNKHVGNVCPSGLPDRVVAEMRRKGDVICRALAGLGWSGVCGVDFLVREADGTVLANEVNARIPAPWYPWQASRRRFGRALPFRMKSVALREGTTVDDIAGVVGMHLFDPASRRGFVPFCFVPEHGFVYGVTFSPDVGDLAGLTALVDDRLASLAP